MNNSSLCAFSVSFMILYISHLVHLKLQSSTLFNFTPPPHKPCSLSEHFHAILQVFGTIHLWSGDKHYPQHSSQLFRGTTIMFLFYSEFSICSYNSVCLQLALGCIFKEPPSQLYQCCILLSVLYCIFAVFSHCFVPVVSSNKPEPGLGSGH